MTPDAFQQTLRGWQGFYALLGGAAATLTGLMFVAASLGTRLINDESDAKVRTFITPTVIHFSLVLLLSALMNVPSQTRATLTAQLAALGLFGALCLVGAALGLSRSASAASGALNAAAVGGLLLVMVGLHNAWGVTLFLVRRTSP